MKNNKIIDVIIVTYNRNYIIWRAILSVLSQTYPFFNLIIVDDGSKDNTVEVIKQFNDPRIQYIYIKHSGVSAARNKGIAFGNSEYIAYLDSDNIWNPDYLYVMFNVLENNPKSVLAYCGINYTLEKINKNGKSEILKEITGIKKPSKEIISDLWNKNLYIDTNQMMHKRKVLKIVGCWDEKMKALVDLDLVLRIAIKYQKGIVSVNKTLVDYVQKIGKSNNISATTNMKKAHKQIYKKYKSFFNYDPKWWKNPIITYQYD